MQNDCKIIQFKSKNNRKVRFKPAAFNYFAPLFFVSLSFNILLLACFLLKD
jgi:hypothetical protein